MTVVQLNPRTKRWFFQISVTSSDGKTSRIWGTPGVSGPYHDLPQTESGARQAERRARATLDEQIAANASATKERPLKEAVHAFIAAELKRDVSRNTIHNVLGVLSRLIEFETGEKTKLHLPGNSTRSVVRAVEPADVERLLAVCEDDRYRAVILLASEVGLRASEIRDLQWADVRDGQLTVPSPKNDKHRTVPVSPRLTTTLATVPRLGRWIVSKLDGAKLDDVTLKREIGAIYDRAGVVRPPALLHCLRLAFWAGRSAEEGK